MQVKNSGYATVSVLLIAAGQIPHDRDVQVSAESENQPVSLPHVVIGHATSFSRSQRIIDMHVRSGLVEQDPSIGLLMSCECFDESPDLFLKVRPEIT